MCPSTAFFLCSNWHSSRLCRCQCMGLTFFQFLFILLYCIPFHWFQLAFNDSSATSNSQGFATGLMARWNVSSYPYPNLVSLLSAHILGTATGEHIVFSLQICCMVSCYEKISTSTIWYNSCSNYTVSCLQRLKLLSLKAKGAGKGLSCCLHYQELGNPPECGGSSLPSLKTFFFDLY